MVENDEGLTKTYNRFHDPDEDAPEIARLRDLHATMDRALLDAYGWTDISTDCDFLLDYAIEKAEPSAGAHGKPSASTAGARKKPYRYRWPDAVRDDILARLLEINTERAPRRLTRTRALRDAAVTCERRIRRDRRTA